MIVMCRLAASSFAVLFVTVLCDGAPQFEGYSKNPAVDTNANSNTLKQLFIIFRHGAKVPEKTFLQGKDKTKWTDYVGELTNEGKMSLFHLGQNIRNRYGNFIDPNYDALRFYIGSTGMDRTLMSAQCFNLGLFPPQGFRVWNKQIQWQPIPIYPWNFSTSGGLAASTDCMGQQLKEMCNNFDAFFNTKDQETLKTVFEVTYGPTSDPRDCNKLPAALGNLDDLTTMIWYNLTLPAALRGMEKDIDDLKTTIMKALFSDNSTCGKALAGELKRNILLYIQNFESGQSNFSTVIFSEHDANVLAAETALSDLVISSPSFGANIIIEVHSSPGNTKENTFVKMFYAQSAEHASQPINFQANGNPIISVDDFKKVLQNQL